jgi:hypothetical protein
MASHDSHGYCGVILTHLQRLISNNSNLHHSPVGHKRRQKGNYILRGIWNLLLLLSATSQSFITTDSQLASLSWCQAPIWCPQPVFPLLSLIIFRHKVAGLFMWDALSDKKMSLSTGLMSTFYCLFWDSPDLWGQVPVFISPSNRVAQVHPLTLGLSN